MFTVMGITGNVGGAVAENLLAGEQSGSRCGAQSREGESLGSARRGVGAVGV